MELSASKRTALQTGFPSFLDALQTSTNRGTRYNTLEEQRAAAVVLHESMLGVDRGIYAMGAMLPSEVDYGRLLAAKTLLSNPYQDVGLLTADEEFKAIMILLDRCQPQRVLKLFAEFADERINNTRTRRAIMSYIMGQDNLEFMAVKYRRKLRTALRHALGVKRAAILKTLLYNKAETVINSVKETEIITSFLRTDNGEIYKIISFILGNENDTSSSLIKKYIDAKTDFSKGKGLPRTTLEGLRRSFHPDIAASEVYNLSENVMTDKEKLITQTAQKKAGVARTKKFDPMSLPLLDLIIYGYENGLEEVTEAIDKKAKAAYDSFPLSYNEVSIIVDASESMIGHDTQRLRPMAAAFAAMRMFQNADVCHLRVVNGNEKAGLVWPEGDTDLASALIDAAEHKSDMVFVITDGYENSIAGRFDEALQLLRKVGWDTPVVQLTGVLAAEKASVRNLSDVPVMPITDPSNTGIAAIKAAFQADPVQGIVLLENAVRRQLS